MADESTPVAGRAATPPPPNTGQSTLGAVLGLSGDPQLQTRRWVHGLMTPGLARDLRSRGIEVFPAVPGLAAESIGVVPARALVIEDAALETGPWAGAGDDTAPELAEQIAELLAQCAELAVPVLRVSATEDGLGPWDEESTLAGALGSAVVIAPGSAMFDGTPEGAPSSLLVTALREHVAAAGG